MGLFVVVHGGGFHEVGGFDLAGIEFIDSKRPFGFTVNDQDIGICDCCHARLKIALTDCPAKRLILMCCFVSRAYATNETSETIFLINYFIINNL